ncbi:MAG: hypothetical protein GX638_11945 [Crenarchaeota archaeon]|nr:hypothetical protein [Thermoproteota archaeon]
MRKRFFEAGAISMLIVVLAMPSVLAFDVGPLYGVTPAENRVMGEYVITGLAVNVGGAGFTYAYFYAGRDLGSAQGFNGYLWWHWYYDRTNYIKWYSSGVSEGYEGPINSDYISARSWSGFYDSQFNQWDQYWACEMVAS